MKHYLATAGWIASIGAMLLIAPGCGTEDEASADDENAGVEGITSGINVGFTSTTRFLPSAGTTALGNYPAETGGNFEVYTASDAAQTKFILQFVNLQSVPVNVCGAFTCNGQKSTFDLTSPVGQPAGVGIVRLNVNGQNCLGGSRFQTVYTVSKNPIPAATCRATKSRI
jgi:hypothetical protein